MLHKVIARQPIEKSTKVVENPPKLDIATFLASPEEAKATTSASSASLLPSTPDREPVRVMVIGTEHGINSIIHTLYAKGFAHISEWSRLMPHSTGKFMRILTRYVQRP